MLQLLSEKGWDRTTVSEIVERASVGRSTFYSHFETKELLLLQLRKRGYAEARTSLDNSQDSQKTLTLSAVAAETGDPSKGPGKGPSNSQTKSPIKSQTKKKKKPKGMEIED